MGRYSKPHRSPRSYAWRRWRRPAWIRSVAPERRRRHLKPDAAGEASRDLASPMIQAGLIPYAAARIGARSLSSLAIAAAWYLGSSSMPTNQRPARSAASDVEPEPATGSRTIPPGGLNASMSGCRAPTDFCGGGEMSGQAARVALATSAARVEHFSARVAPHGAGERRAQRRQSEPLGPGTTHPPASLRITRRSIAQLARRTAPRTVMAATTNAALRLPVARARASRARPAC